MSKALPPLPAFLLLTGFLYTLAACRAPQKTTYFQTLPRDTVLQNTVSRDFDLKIKAGDLLTISISSASPELSGLFNTAPGGGSATAEGGYAVDKSGKIQLYKLGDVKAAGLTLPELKATLQTDLLPYLKDPLVTVHFANQRVTVLGAVGSPGVVPLPSGQLSLLEALGQSGDLAEGAKRNNILVIRQTAAGKEFKHLNLLDHSVFSSPYFYLQNEDVVYVEPEPKKEAAKTQQVISYLLTGLSVVTLILSRIK